MNPKFIIVRVKPNQLKLEEGLHLIAGSTTLHRNLIDGTNGSLDLLGKVDLQVLGGGWFKYNPLDHTVYFYSSSMDFGRVEVTTLKQVLESGHLHVPKFWEGITVCFSPAESFDLNTFTEVGVVR